MQVWIIECPVCGEPFEVADAAMPMRAQARLHARPTFPTQPCSGSGRTSYVVMRKEDYPKSA